MSFEAYLQALGRWFDSLRKLVAKGDGELLDLRPRVPVGSGHRPVASPTPRKPNETPEWGLQAIFEHSAVGIALLDHEFRIVHANAAFERFLGLRMIELLGRPITDFSSIEDAEITAAVLREVGDGRRSAAAVEARFTRRDESTGWGALSVSLAGDTPDLHFVAILQDVTERKALEAQLVHQAYHDPLTDLPNRTLFRDRVEQALSRSMREPTRLAVIFLDLDNFKVVNDTQGHGGGDILLQIVARRLLSATRGCDTVARVGGDEFAVLLELDENDGAELVLDRMVAALRPPMELETDRIVNASASIGIALYTGSEGAEELLRNADVAMYEAKLHARGRWVVFDPAMHAALIDRATMEADLIKALERCQLLDRPRLANTGKYPSFMRLKPQTEFSVVYQPIVDLATGRLTAVEALARWEHPERGAISPESFVPAAERSGAISALGRWVLRQACYQGARWNATRPDDPLTVTVNLSGRQLDHEGIAAEVDAVLRESGLAPHLLVLEITETVIMQNAESTLARLTELKRLGVRLAIDDFGTGYSSLSYLQRFPIEILKIDRVFTVGLQEGPDGAALIRTILAMATMLSLCTIAEGVEDPEQCEQLRSLGCNAGQGYLFGRPLMASEIDEAFSGSAAVADRDMVWSSVFQSHP